MGLFSKKKEVALADFCREFYEKNIMNPMIQELDVNAAFVDVIIRSITEVDQSFAKVNSQKFAKEYLLLRFELFALAWLHQFGEKLAVAQSVFTKDYLHEKNRDDIWDDLEFYNQAIARSSTIGRKTTNGFDRAYLMRVNKTKADQFDHYYREGYDTVAVARALNRLFTEKAWKKGITAELIRLAVCDRLGFKPNDEARFRLNAVICSLLYDGAHQSLANVRIRAICPS